MDFAIVVYYLGIYLDVSLRFVSMGLMPGETNFIKVECSPSGAEINPCVRAYRGPLALCTGTS